MASACMGDIAILEVALRNRMDRQLSLLALEQNGTEDWYMAGLQFDDRTQYQIREAWNHLTPHQRKNHTHGHLIASLTFGFWRNLLEDGGTIHTKWPDQRRADYENDLWRKGLDKTFSNGRQYARAVEERWTRKYALDIVKTVHALRNRVAHHEPLVNGIPLPGENRRIALENATQACFALAMILDRESLSNTGDTDRPRRSPGHVIMSHAAHRGHGRSRTKPAIMRLLDTMLRLRPCAG